MTAKTLMVQGTASDAGKTLFVAALCRIFSNMGYKVAPFKSQNMSLNSFVTASGEEIARSQVLQAIAARTDPIKEHNPILLKPKGNNKSQIILMGKPLIDYSVNEYYKSIIPKLIPAIKKSLSYLMENNDIVIIEGAGSPAEINLSKMEIANMFVAKLYNIPVILIADIDKGGVFASIYGTIKLLNPEEQQLIKGFVINKFRGDVELLIPGIKKIEKLIDRKSVGIIPYIDNLKLPSEDSLGLKNTDHNGKLNIVVIKFPKISNFTDFEPLSWEEEINLSYVQYPWEIHNPDLIILPGTKNTIQDLKWLKKQGFVEILKELHKQNVLIIGICGGYQMLGQEIIDPAIEGDIDMVYEGLKYLPISTQFKEYQKITRQIEVRFSGIKEFEGEPIKGYEIHMGEVNFNSKQNLIFQPLEKSSNQISPALGITNNSQNIIGTFIHGLFENNGFREKLIKMLLKKKKEHSYSTSSYDFNSVIEKNLDKLTKIIESSIDLNYILQIMGIK